jgi:hypothetical protein
MLIFRVVSFRHFMSYTVLVDDNFHYMDEDERYTLGAFESLDVAIAACKKLVDDFLKANHKPGITADELYAAYTSFGEDPFIAGAGEMRPFVRLGLCQNTY